MKTKINRKPLIDYINLNKDNVDNLFEFNKYYPEDSYKTISINRWIEEIGKSNFSLIDVRSEKEFHNSTIPGAINFPILTTKERDEVGFVYKQMTEKGALFLAIEYAEKKDQKINELIDKHNNIKFNLFCWRGSGRSSSLTSILSKKGVECKKIIGGYKSYRTQVYNSFYVDSSKYNFVPLSGFTGCGKTEILESLGNEVPIFDIEKAASHASSQFGKVRFNLQNMTPVKSQQQFENNLFFDLIKPCKNKNLPFLTEAESKKINNFHMPNVLFDRLLLSPSIKLECSIENRVKRIVKEYFTGDGIKQVYDVVEKSNCMKTRLGKQQISDLLALLDQNRIEEFSEWFLVQYYDKIYGTKYENIIETINCDNISKARNDIVEILNSNLVSF